jgi:Integrase core domain
LFHRKDCGEVPACRNGDPLENPVAERINGILKEECYPLIHYHHVTALVADLIEHYNNLRPRRSIDMITPEVVHEKNYRLIEHVNEGPNVKLFPMRLGGFGNANGSL